MTRKARGSVVCLECRWSRILQYYDGSINDPLIAECHGERFVASYHSCKEAEATKETKTVIRISKRD